MRNGNEESTKLKPVSISKKANTCENFSMTKTPFNKKATLSTSKLDLN
jgi:hypothetical protein